MKKKQEEQNQLFLASNSLNNWRLFLEFQWQYKKWYLITFIISVIIGLIYFESQNQISSYKAMVMIKDPQVQIEEMSMFNAPANKKIALRRNRRTSRSSFSYKSFIENEELVMHSGVLMEKLVKKLDLHTIYTIKESFHRVELYKDAPYQVTLDSVNLQQMKFALNLQLSHEKNGFLVKGKYKNKKFEKTVPSLPAKVQTPVGSIDIQQVPKSRYADDDIFVTVLPVEKVVRTLLKTELVTDISKQTDAITLFYKTGNDEKAKDVLNTLIKLYNEQAREQVFEDLAQTSRFLNERLALLQQELALSEQEIQQYKQEQLLQTIPQNASLFIKQQAAYYNRMVDMDMKMQQTNLILTELLQKKEYQLVTAPDVDPESSLHKVMAQYNQLVLDRKRLMDKTSTNNPVFVKLNEELILARKALIEQLQQLKGSQQIQWDGFLKQNNSFVQKLKLLPEQERIFNAYIRKQQVQEQLYIHLLQKQEETSMGKSALINQARMLNAPMFEEELTPQPWKAVFLVLLLGLGFPVGLIELKRRLNTKISDRRDVEAYSIVPIISELTHLDNDEESFINQQNNANPNAELIRLLRNKVRKNLDLAGKKVIVVTSTQPGEGKTFVSMNLAISLSLAGKKVLLVGMDMRKPQLARYFNIKQKQGLSSILSENFVDTDKLIHNLKEYPLLSVLSAGVIPPNPNELLSKDKLDHLIAHFESQFDYIIIDSAPVGAVSDTLLLSRLTDISLYVVRANVSDKRNLDYLNRLWQENALNNIHIVLNDVAAPMYQYGYFETKIEN